MKRRTRILLSVILTCLLLPVTVAVGLWVYDASPGWRFVDMEFHPSWSEPERAAIRRLDKKLRAKYDELGFFMDLVTPAEPLSEGRRQIAEAVQLLETAAACGRGDVYGRNGCQPAWYAAWMDEPLLVKALVQRGADPNKPYLFPAYLDPSSLIRSDVLCAVVMHGGYSAADELHLGAKEALELTEWLLANGADWRKSSSDMLSSCVVTGVMTMHEKDSDFAAELAVRMCIRMNGLPDDKMNALVSVLMNRSEGCSLPYLHRLSAAGLLPRRVLEREVGSVLCFLRPGNPYAVEYLRWLLDDMKLNVNHKGVVSPDPSRRADEDDMVYEFRLREHRKQNRRMYPLSFILRYMILPDSEAERERVLKCLEMLLQRGARYCRADFGELNIPGILELLNKYPEQEEK